MAVIEVGLGGRFDPTNVITPEICAIASIGLEAVIAVLNELSQLIPDGRACSARDMLIDFAGAAIGVLIAWALNRRREHKERQGVEL